ncbi:MAG TPA: response regulator [Terriglobales bacterium]|nr:response regulator [Terriglobales bacterium]
MRVRFWGTRGSIATPGPTTLRYGGNTSCIEVVTNSGYRFIFDSGTGIRPLGLDLIQKSAQKPIDATILLGHTHWDHIQGFPFFMPAFEPGNKFTVVAPKGMGRSLADVLSGQMEFTYFPVELDQLPARIEFRELGEGIFDFGGARVITQFINHPAPCLGYRIEADGVIVVYLCDHEPFSENLWREGAGPGRPESILHEGDRRHANFMRHADLVIHDAQYTPEEYPAKRNWGHSTYEYAVELAAMSDVRQLALTHHDPTHDDATIAEIERRARNLARRRNFLMHVFCAYEGLEMGITGSDSDRVRTIDLDPAAPTSMRKMKVLVVDDDPNLRLLAAATLKREGYVITEAGDGIEALKRVADEQPDVIVLDLDMPRLNGMDTLRRLRASSSSVKEVPVLILTAHGDEASTRAGFDAGATDYLAKPFTPPQLTARLRACLSRATAAAGTR